MNKIASTELAAYALLGLAGVYLLWKTTKIGAGVLSGDNALTRNATNAAGQPVTAYLGSGVLGTLGAAANVASGGTLASFGQWIGGKVYDLANPAPTVADAAPTGAASANFGSTPNLWPGDAAAASWSDLAGVPGFGINP